MNETFKKKSDYRIENTHGSLGQARNWERLPLPKKTHNGTRHPKKLLPQTMKAFQK